MSQPIFYFHILCKSLLLCVSLRYIMEIERKFLIKGDFKLFSTGHVHIMQGYLSSVPERTVRVRIWGEKGFLTIKGKSNASGMSRYEWEKEIPVDEARQLLSLCQPTIIEKTRYFVPEKSGLKYEVDIFHGAHEGLVMAELELPTEEVLFDKPTWLGEEVTGDTHYYNSYLSSKGTKSHTS